MDFSFDKAEFRGRCGPRVQLRHGWLLYCNGETSKNSKSGAVILQRGKWVGYGTRPEEEKIFTILGAFLGAGSGIHAKALFYKYLRKTWGWTVDCSLNGSLAGWYLGCVAANSVGTVTNLIKTGFAKAILNRQGNR